MKKYNVYDSRLNADTHNSGGLEWIVDGERGYRSYPGTLPECMARRLYEDGLSYSSIVGIAYCDGCTGAEKGKYCRKEAK